MTKFPWRPWKKDKAGSELAVSPEDVFTPRLGTVTDMYVPRPDLERSVARIFRSDEVVYLHGVSGSGKSWLYKKVFEERNVFFRTIGMHNFPVGDLDAAYASILKDLGEVDDIQFTAEGRAKAKVSIGGVGASAEVTQQTTSQNFQEKRLLRLVRAMRRAAGPDVEAVLVFENVERAVGSNSAMQEIVSIIMSSDDQNFSEQRVKFLFVGIVPDLINKLATMEASTPVLTRIAAVEVAPMSVIETKQLLERGLFEKLGLKSDVTIDQLVHTVRQNTAGIPLHIHWYCRELATEARTHGKIDNDAIQRANDHWIEKVIKNQYDRVIGFTNANDTEKKVRTKVLYVIARMEIEKFRPLDVKQELDNHFRKDNISMQIVTTSLNELAGRIDRPSFPKDPLLEIIERRSGGNEYRFKGPLERVATRLALELRDGVVRRAR